jgi:hypothetical protein
MWNKMKLSAQIRIAQRTEREREREKNGAPKSHVLTSGSLVANPKSDPDYSVFTMKYLCFFKFTYPLRCLRVPQIEYHWSNTWPVDKNMYLALLVNFIDLHGHPNQNSFCFLFPTTDLTRNCRCITKCGP